MSAKRKIDLKNRIIKVIKKADKPLAVETIRKKVNANYVTVERTILNIIIEVLQKNPKTLTELNLPFIPMKTSKSLILIPKKLYGGVRDENK